MTGDELRQEIASERRDLLNHVNALRLAVAELRPNEMRSKRLPSALQEAPPLFWQAPRLLPVWRSASSRGPPSLALT